MSATSRFGESISLKLLILLAVMPLSFAQMNEDGRTWRSPDPGVNNIWFARNPSSDTVFVFVHGIHSDSRCWLYEENGQPKQYWPYLVWQDERLRHPSVFLGGYTFGAHYNIFDAVLELLRNLINQKILDYPNIVFVAHSMGGVVVRRMLCSYVAEFHKSRLGLLLFASPSSGSSWADLASFLQPGNSVDRLRSEDPYLVELDQEFKTLTSGRRLNITGAEVVEGDGYLGTPAQVVGRASAARYFDYRTLPGDHSSLVKPQGLGSLSHEFVVDFYGRFAGVFKEPEVTIAAPPPDIPTIRSAPKLSFPPEDPTIPSQGILHCPGSPVQKNGKVIFDNLPPKSLRFAFDRTAWQGLIQRQPNGKQRLTLISLKPGIQKDCEVRWETVQDP